MAKTSFYLLVNQTAGEKACKKTAGKEDLSDFVGRYERCSISGSVQLMVEIPLLSLVLYLARWGRTCKGLLSSSKPQYFTSGQSALWTLSKGEIDWGGILANDNEVS